MPRKKQLHKMGKYMIPDDLAYCYPYYRELQKGMRASDFVRLVKKHRVPKINPLPHPPKIKKGRT